MKFYIGSTNGSGIEANTFEDFIKYLRNMAEIAEKQKEEWFEVNVETYLAYLFPDEVMARIEEKAK